MLVSIACEGCSAAVGVADLACRVCGRTLTRDERDALEARFEAASADYRDAKAVVGRALTVSLVIGLLTLAFASMRLLLQLESGGDLADPMTIGAAVLDLLLGITLGACFFAGKRAPAAAVGVAAAISVVVLLSPFLVAPGPALLQFASPVGVVLNLCRVMALILIAQGIVAVRVMKSLLASVSRQAEPNVI